MIEFNIASLYAVSPSLALCFGALLILIVCAFAPGLDRRFYAPFSMVIVGVALAFSLFVTPSAESAFNDLFISSQTSQFASLIMLVGGFVFLPFCLGDDTSQKGEFYALFLFMLAALILMASSLNLIMIFIALETSSLALYSLIALSGKRTSIEAGIKYFSMGALGAGLFVFGSAMLYLGSSSLDLRQIFNAVNSGINQPFFALGAVFMMAGLGFKLSLVPFHTWVVDVYRGAFLSFAGFISVVPKVAASVVAMTVFGSLIQLNYFGVCLEILAIATMSVANIAALATQDMRKMLAYSSVSHAGFIMVAILIGGNGASWAMLAYWGLLLFANLGIFGLFACLGIKGQIKLEYFNGLFKQAPALALFIALFLLALVGVPPLSVFWGKMLIIFNAINEGYSHLAVIMLINSAIACVYYIRPILAMFAKPAEQNATSEIKFQASSGVRFGLGLCALFTCFGFLFIS